MVPAAVEKNHRLEVPMEPLPTDGPAGGRADPGVAHSTGRKPDLPGPPRVLPGEPFGRCVDVPFAHHRPDIVVGEAQRDLPFVAKGRARQIHRPVRVPVRGPQPLGQRVGFNHDPLHSGSFHTWL